MILKPNQNKEEWHTWYAWHPVKLIVDKRKDVDGDEHDVWGLAWFEKVKRKKTFYCSNSYATEYMLPTEFIKRKMTE